MSETTMRQNGAKKNASLSLGIDPFSIKGSYSDEFSKKEDKQEDEKTDQKQIDWTGYGGNPALVSLQVLDHAYHDFLVVSHMTLLYTKTRFHKSAIVVESLQTVVSRPEKWLPTVANYRYWEVINVRQW